MKVLAAFLRAPRPRHVRELASVCGLSPGGVSDILRRLRAAGVLRQRVQGNRTCYSLTLSEQERLIFGQLFARCEEARLQERARRLGGNARDRLEWMDEAYAYFREVKGGQ